MNPNNKKTVFLLEDDESFAIVFARWLKERGYEVKLARSEEEARKHLQKIEPPSLFWFDYYLGEQKTVEELLKMLHENERFKSIPIIIVSITVDMQKLGELKKYGNIEVFSKLLTNREEILQAVDRMTGNRN
ncbi:MAG: response regulator [Candidatus Portnoybacteria bacterium]|nr:response regulator [Candidatus Portnoybacteria bacterium]